MWGAFGWGTLAASSLVIGAIIALLFRIGLRTIGLIMAFGAGVLISAVAFDLVEEAFGMSSGHGWVIAGIFAGCAVFFGGDWLIDRSGGSERKDAKGGQQGGSSLAIVLGSVLDGIPESMVIGLTIFQGGGVGAAYLIAVFISNLPESISSTSGLVASGWKKARVLWMWIAIALVSGLASLAGYALFQHSSPDVVAFVLAFAAGAILTMLANTMMPEAYDDGGKMGRGRDDDRFRRRVHDPRPRLTHRILIRSRKDEREGSLMATHLHEKPIGCATRWSHWAAGRVSRAGSARVVDCSAEGSGCMSTLASYPGMMQRARKREGLRVCRAAWLVGVSVREYREIEAGDGMPSLRTYERIAELYGWPERFEGRVKSG